LQIITVRDIPVNGIARWYSIAKKKPCGGGGCGDGGGGGGGGDGGGDGGGEVQYKNITNALLQV
jgi:hypothetical protein